VAGDVGAGAEVDVLAGEAGQFAGEAEQESQGVAVGHDGVRAAVALADWLSIWSWRTQIRTVSVARIPSLLTTALIAAYSVS
jgi:hypothetical protein